MRAASRVDASFDLGREPRHEGVDGNPALGLVGTANKSYQYRLFTVEEWQHAAYFRDRWNVSPKLTLDLCRLCQLIWFDRGEFERWPKTAVKKLPEEAEQALALADVEFRSELARIDPNTRKMRRDEANFDRAVRVGKSFVTGGPLSPWTWFNILRDEIQAVIDNIRA